MNTKVLRHSFILLLLFLFLGSCDQRIRQKTAEYDINSRFSTLYSTSVQDSFQISVQYPAGYNQDSSSSYPVVVITDSDFYFPMLAPVVKQYEVTGLLPPLFLVGVGYGSLQKMDSLRVRDFMYPAAIPSDEMEANGGGRNYYRFLTEELLPHLDLLHVDPEECFLMGHSFGGYFTLFALLEQIREKRQDFKGFVSASPSLWYNDFYLQRHASSYATSMDSVRLFLTVGGHENQEWGIRPFESFAAELERLQPASLTLGTQIYPGLDHMDVGLFSFVQGIKSMLTE